MQNTKGSLLENGALALDDLPGEPAEGLSLDSGIGLELGAPSSPEHSGLLSLDFDGPEPSTPPVASPSASPVAPSAELAPVSAQSLREDGFGEGGAHHLELDSGLPALDLDYGKVGGRAQVAPASSLPDPGSFEPATPATPIGRSEQAAPAPGGQSRRANMRAATAMHHQAQRRTTMIRLVVLLMIVYGAWRGFRWMSWDDGQLQAFEIASNREIPDDRALEAIAGACTHIGRLNSAEADKGVLYFSYAQDLAQGGLNVEQVRSFSSLDLGRIIHCVALAGHERGLKSIAVDQQLRDGAGSFYAEIDLSKVRAIPKWKQMRWTGKPELYYRVFEEATVEGRGYLSTRPLSAHGRKW